MKGNASKERAAIIRARYSLKNFIDSFSFGIWYNTITGADLDAVGKCVFDGALLNWTDLSAR